MVYTTENFQLSECHLIVNRHIITEVKSLLLASDQVTFYINLIMSYRSLNTIATYLQNQWLLRQTIQSTLKSITFTQAQVDFINSPVQTSH